MADVKILSKLLKISSLSLLAAEENDLVVFS